MSPEGAEEHERLCDIVQEADGPRVSELLRARRRLLFAWGDHSNGCVGVGRRPSLSRVAIDMWCQQTNQRPSTASKRLTSKFAHLADAAAVQPPARTRCGSDDVIPTLGMTWSEVTKECTGGCITVPQLLRSFADKEVESIHAGGEHSAAVVSHPRYGPVVYVWGRNTYSTALTR